jgi:uncharacterized protein (DUF433 family)
MDTNNPRGISVKQTVRFGKPCIEGTRIAIVDLLNLLKMGYSIKEIPAQYPGVTLKQVKTALDYAAKVIGKEEVLEINSVG